MEAKPVVFLLPGLLCDEAVWQHQINALSPFYDVQVPVLRGFDSFRDMARHVLEQAPARFSLVGHSMGGRVALEVMDLAGARVDHLVLMSLGVHPVAPNEPAERCRLLKIAEQQGLPAVVDSLLEDMLPPECREAEELTKSIRAMMLRSTRRDLEGQIMAALQRDDHSAYLPAIRQKVLLICGEKDAWSPVSQHEQIQRMLAAAELATVKDAGHMITMEKPQCVNTLLLNWLRQSFDRNN